MPIFFVLAHIVLLQDNSKLPVYILLVHTDSLIVLRFYEIERMLRRLRTAIRFVQPFWLNLKWNIEQCRKRHIVTEKSLVGVANVVEFLKESITLDVRLREIFRSARHDQRIIEIAKEIRSGGPSLFRTLEENSVRDVAAALQYFLIYLRKPLIPVYIQGLVLDSDSQKIEPLMIAQDVLGLLKQDLEPRHLDLLKLILDLLYAILTYSPSDELSGCNVPISMMPIFFQMQTEHLSQWRRVATVFVEIIRLAPELLNIVQPHLYDENDLEENFVTPRAYNVRPHNLILHQRLVDMNQILRRYLVRTGR